MEVVPVEEPEPLPGVVVPLVDVPLELLLAVLVPIAPLLPVLVEP